MRRESHVRFCERLEGETPSCLLSASVVKIVFQKIKDEEAETDVKLTELAEK
jgi:hypothetical protein